MIDGAVLLRIEEAGINASAPREQLFIDGWLVRFAAGKAKRGRCVQAVAPGLLGVDQRIVRCLQIFADAGLPPIFRITPFSQPTGLDALLADQGMERLDETVVMVTRAAGVLAAAAAGPTRDSPSNIRFEAAPDTAAFAEWIGAARNSSPIERLVHAERLQQSPVRQHPYFAFASDISDLENRSPLAAGLVAVEGRLAGLYDVHTLAAARQRGLATRLCRHLTSAAMALGADTVYLQVAADNTPARSLYQSIGFVEAYRYHYRVQPA